MAASKTFQHCLACAEGHGRHAIDCPHRDNPDGFDVTREEFIGRVLYSDSGAHNPIETAFLLIARHGRDGVYRMPGEHEGVTLVVTVEGRELPDDSRA